MKNYFVFFLFSFLVFSSCKEEKPEETIALPNSNESADFSKLLIQEEEEFIKQFIARNNWKMNYSESGLKYLIYKKGTGEKAEPGMKAMVDFSITLLDGSEVYNTKESGPQPFHIEQDNVEAGIHEGITYMHVGDRAKLILPPHLGHGLMGDQYKIPPLATLVFDIRLLGLSK